MSENLKNSIGSINEEVPECVAFKALANGDYGDDYIILGVFVEKISFSLTILE